MGFDIIRFELLVEPKPYYRNGDKVNCMLIIELNGVLKCKHVFLTAIGQVGSNLHNQIQYTKTRHFMTIPLNLRDLVRNETIETGVHRIPFDFYLTNAYLSTFKVKNGHIVYYIEATIDKKIFSKQIFTTRKEIKVKTHSNILPPEIHGTPVAANREKLIRWFGIKIGSVRLSAHIDKNIFFCGEIIYINFHLSNRSSKTIRLLPQLIQKTSFKYEQAYLDSSELMGSTYAEVCSENGSQSDIVCINIPNDCISTVNTNFVDITYYINLFVDISGSTEHFDEIPIFIN